MDLRLRLVITLACCALGLSSAAEAVPWTERQKLVASDRYAGDYFAYSVSISGAYAVMGAYGNDDCGSSSGSAYVFEKGASGWNEVGKLLPSDGAADDYFGYSVSISGTTTIVGAYLNDDYGSNSGSAYVFEKGVSGWNQVAKLLPSDGAATDHFGYSVAISGTTAFVGAYQDDDCGNKSGSAYVFEKGVSGWTQVAKLHPSDGAEYDYFGYSVSVSGTTAVVGAELSSANGFGSGSAYVFENNVSGWKQTAKIVPADGAASDQFGYSVAISGTTIAVGTDQDDDCGHDSGSAYVFEKDVSGWRQVAKLLPSDGLAYDYFGSTVAVSGTTVFVGGRRGDELVDPGTAYVFERDASGWTEIARLLPSDDQMDDWFGRAVALSGTTALVGAYATGTGVGSAYIFTALVPGDGNGDGKVDGGDLALWQQNYDPLGLSASTFAMGDWNGDGKIDGGDLALWQQNYNPLGLYGSSLGSPQALGVVPEPGTLVLAATAVLGAAGVIRGRVLRRRRGVSSWA